MKKSDMDIIKAVKYIDNEAFYKGIKNTQLTHTTKVVEGYGNVPYITFEPFQKFDFVECGFSTRLGGVSTGIYESMNLAFNREDDPILVQENFKRITEVFHTTPENCVYSKQTHTTNVMSVGRKQLGMGVTRERDFDNIDGIVTNETEVCLVTAYADCVPLFFIDPVHGCVGASHSGWRGTIGNITAETLRVMNQEYGTQAEDVYTVIGPSICKDCYEVSEDVAIQFENVYACDTDRIVTPKGAGKYLLNLQMANYYNMRHGGILDEHIGIADICTCCNPELLYSHRASKGKRGVLCGFIKIKG